MAKNATGEGKREGGTKGAGDGRSVTASVRKRADEDRGGIGEAVAKLLQSPLVADLIAVAATAALAALAEHGFSKHGDGKKSSSAVKAAGIAAAAAIGRRIGTEFEEIRKAASAAKGA